MDKLSEEQVERLVKSCENLAQAMALAMGAFIHLADVAQKAIERSEAEARKG